MEIRKLIEIWESGEATPAQEAELREFFSRDMRVIPEDLRAWAVLFGGFRELGSVTMDRPLALRRTGVSGRLRAFAWTLSASFAAVAVVLGLYFSKEPYCYVDGRAVRNADRAMEAVSSLEALDALGDCAGAFDLLEGLDF